MPANAPPSAVSPVAPAATRPAKPAVARRPRRSGVLAVAVDDKQARRLARAVGEGEVICCGDLDEARRLLGRKNLAARIGLVVSAGADSAAVLPMLRDLAPAARAVAAEPGQGDAVAAFRAGFIDVLGREEWHDPEELAGRLHGALLKADELARAERRLAKLRRTVRKLNAARRQVGRRVDVLCTDLVGAYGELAKQMDELRLRQELLDNLDHARDVEQLLCRKMDWLLRRLGHCNIAVYLANDENGLELGAYMKYTTPGERPLTDALADNLARVVQARGTVHADPAALSAVLSPKELPHLQGQTVLAADCQYLAESLAVVICFRDGRSPFSGEDREALEAAGPHFAVALAQMVREGCAGGDEDEDDDAEWDEHGDDDGGLLDEGEDDDTSADWWKAGNRLPF